MYVWTFSSTIIGQNPGRPKLREHGCNRFHFNFFKILQYHAFTSHPEPWRSTDKLKVAWYQLASICSIKWRLYKWHNLALHGKGSLSTPYSYRYIWSALCGTANSQSCHAVGTGWQFTNFKRKVYQFLQPIYNNVLPCKTTLSVLLWLQTVQREDKVRLNLPTSMIAQNVHYGLFRKTARAQSHAQNLSSLAHVYLSHICGSKVSNSFSESSPMTLHTAVLCLHNRTFLGFTITPSSQMHDSNIGF